MQPILKLCVGLCIILSVPALAYAKDWRGIVPMRSTRADVEMLLGRPQAPPKNGYRVDTLNKGRSLYSLADGEVFILFADAEIPAAVDCLARIPANTVLSIHFTPKKELAFNDLAIDESKFRKFDPSQPPDLGYAAFINEQEGLIVRTFNSKVEQIIYIASAADKGLCPSYYENSETIAGLIVCRLPLSNAKFDEYGDLSFADEKARLDNFAIQLQTDTESVGYIVVYAGRRARSGEALTRASRARAYVVDNRKIELGRVVATDGGHREDFTVELFVGPTRAAPPELTPTVQPSEVELIYDREKPRRRTSAKP